MGMREAGGWLTGLADRGFRPQSCFTRVYAPPFVLECASPHMLKPAMPHSHLQTIDAPEGKALNAETFPFFNQVREGAA